MKLIKELFTDRFICLNLNKIEKMIVISSNYQQPKKQLQLIYTEQNRSQENKEMEKQPIKKRVTCLNIYNKLQTYAILLDDKLGQGYFGTVMKAYNEDNQYQMLAVKVIPINGDKDYQATIDKEIDIIYQLGDHPNLVKVVPVKCRSQNNYYIFMEYCDQGTLQQSIKEKLINRDYFTQPQIFKTFYEVLSGYKVIYEKNIIHQDLKPENILIKKEVHKITDFGFSMFNKGDKIGTKRQGTLEYMPLQKLTEVDYIANAKSDVYSLGVIFFKMITGRHPYILRSYEDIADFISLLKSTELRPPAYVRARMSIPMQHLFDLIIKMIAKEQQKRTNFDQIYKYIEDQEAFLAFLPHQTISQSQIVLSEQIHVPNDVNSVHSRFVEYSTAFAVPFSVMKTEEQAFEQMFRIKNLEEQKRQQQRKKFQTIIKIENYLCSMRMMVYFFDRLTRRLSVERKRRQVEEIEFERIPPSLEVDQRVIIYLVFLSLKITKQTLNESPKSSLSQLSLSNWSSEQWYSYRQRRPNVLDLIRNDENYLQSQKQQLILEQAQQSKIQDIKQIIDESKKGLNEFMRYNVRPCLQQLFKNRGIMMGLEDRRSWVTMYYIMQGIDIMDEFEERQGKWEEMEGYFREVEMKEMGELREMVHGRLKKYGVYEVIDEGEWVEGEQD